MSGGVSDTFLGLDAMVAPILRDAVRDGIESGCQMAIDALAAAQPHTDPANQTWDSARAVLALVKAEYVARRSALPNNQGERGPGDGGVGG